MRAETRISFAALATVPFVMVLSNSMIIPALPAIQKALGRSLFQVGLLITAFSVSAGLVIPIGGYLSDRYGRKKVMIPCLLLFGLGGLIAALAPLLWPKNIYTMLMGARILQGIGGGGTYQVAMALAGDIFKSGERSKVLGLLEASNGLGKVVSPIIGAAAMTLFWFAPFFVYPVIAWTSAALVWAFVREPQGTTTDRSLGGSVRGVGRVFAHKGPSLATCFLAGALALFFLFGVLSYYADVLEQRYHVQGVARGLVIAIPVAVMAATSYAAGTFLVRRLSRLSKTMVLVGLGLVCIAFVAMFLTSRNIVAFTTAISVMGFGNGVLLPSINTMITSASSSRERGTVTALYGTVRFFGAAFGPPAFDRAVRTGSALPYLGSAALALGALLAAAAWLNQRQLLDHLKNGNSQKDRKQTMPSRTHRRPESTASPGRSGNRLH